MTFYHSSYTYTWLTRNSEKRLMAPDNSINTGSHRIIRIEHCKWVPGLSRWPALPYQYVSTTGLTSVNPTWSYRLRHIVYSPCRESNRGPSACEADALTIILWRRTVKVHQSTVSIWCGYTIPSIMEERQEWRIPMLMDLINMRDDTNCDLPADVMTNFINIICYGD